MKTINIRELMYGDIIEENFAGWGEVIGMTKDKVILRKPDQNTSDRFVRFSELVGIPLKKWMFERCPFVESWEEVGPGKFYFTLPDSPTVYEAGYLHQLQNIISVTRNVSDPNKNKERIRKERKHWLSYYDIRRTSED